MDYPSLQPERYYHLFNRGNNREDLFRETRNYAFFLDRYTYHVEPVAETFAYCLMKNHVHVLVRIRPEAAWPEDGPGPERRFANLFSSYAKAINKAYGRTGSLFQKRFGRIEVTDERYFLHLVRYIHQNPQRHGFVDDFRDYPHSSYHTYLALEKKTRLQREATLALFGGVETFCIVHETLVSPDHVNPVIDHDFETQTGPK
jgi:putative transposase